MKQLSFEFDIISQTFTREIIEEEIQDIIEEQLKLLSLQSEEVQDGEYKD